MSSSRPPGALAEPDPPLSPRTLRALARLAARRANPHIRIAAKPTECPKGLPGYRVTFALGKKRMVAYFCETLSPALVEEFASVHVDTLCSSVGRAWRPEGKKP